MEHVNGYKGESTYMETTKVHGLYQDNKGESIIVTMFQSETATMGFIHHNSSHTHTHASQSDEH